MSLDLPHLIESAADEVASVGRAAAGSLNELVHDWGHETRTFVSEHAPSLPGVSSHRSHSSSRLRLLLPLLVLGVVAFMVMRRRRPHATPHLPERHTQDHLHETVSASTPKGSSAKDSSAKDSSAKDSSAKDSSAKDSKDKHAEGAAAS